MASPVYQKRKKRPNALFLDSGGGEPSQVRLRRREERLQAARSPRVAQRRLRDTTADERRVRDLELVQLLLSQGLPARIGL